MICVESLIWALQVIKKKSNGPRGVPDMTLMVPLPVSMADLKQEDEKYEECDTASQFGYVPQTEGPSLGHR